MYVQATYCAKAAQLLDHQPVFLDEAGFKSKVIKGRGRSRIGSRAVIMTRSGDNANVTLIAAISPTAGVLYHELHVGSTDGDRFATFIYE
jgi:hypothetical protein